ncbi:poly [ADP-ribose] polymerase 1 [Protopterus annectens]|uniref:poly [ADP-ribose] polymerase 1 n=1 Tax=Protopterus annectens TaxID=7888 RepID=UPI001CF9CC29|nr:poly [ADP-ribose] polymerase 1 [Protopterus annectens]
MAEEKPYKAEYAKSGRASCKKCKENISKDILRMAIMVQSPMFDGKIPHWYHYSCFWQRARVLSTADIDGFPDLRWEDQEKIKKAVDTGGDSGAFTLTPGDDMNTSITMRRAASFCLHDQIRISKKMIDPEKPQLGMIDRWYHPDCFVSRRDELGFMSMYSATQIKGFLILNAEDKEFLKKKLPVTQGEGKRKGAEGVAVVPAKKKKEKEKEAKEEQQLKLFLERGYPLEFILKIKDEVLDKRNDRFYPILGKAEKSSDILETMNSAGLEKSFPKESNNFNSAFVNDFSGDALIIQKVWKKPDTIEPIPKRPDKMLTPPKDCPHWNKAVPVVAMVVVAATRKELAEQGSSILDRVADGMAFGRLLPCEDCGGQYVFKTDAYYCTGNLTAWTKCVNKTQKPKREDWTIPKEFHEISFLKKFKFKKQDRMFPPTAVSPTSLPVSSSVTASIFSSAPTGRPKSSIKLSTLLGKLFLASDRCQKKLTIAKGGGRCGSVNHDRLCIKTKRDVDKMNKKMEEVKTANVRVVSEDFLNDAKSSGKPLLELLSIHGLSSWGAEVKEENITCVDGKLNGSSVVTKSTGKIKEEGGSSKSEKKMKLTVKGGAAIDPETGLENCAHVLEQNGKIFSATLGLVDISRGTNSYYKLQLLESDDKRRYWVFRSWGRVGTQIGGNKLESASSKESAIDQFLDLYEEKTGNSWHSKNFNKYPNKFYPIEIDYGQDDEAVKKLAVSAGTNSKLPKAVQKLIKMIFDIESMKKAMVEFEIDLQKMPLGKLSKRQIQSAYSILTEVQQVISDGGTEPQILDLSNRFYTLIPHDFGMKKPPLLDNLEYIQTKVEMLDNLLDIEVAYSLLKGGGDDTAKDPIDVNYEKLKTDIKVLDKSTEEAKILCDYVKNTHAATHNTYELEVVDIFKICREGEYQRYRPFKELHNRMLLWHGSRATNYAGILSQGLRIAPPEAPVTGYMFGKGVYFADMVSKSANYCHTSQADPHGLILLGEVALGNMYELKRASHITKLPKGKHSVKGLGRTVPDPNITSELDGVHVPLGLGVPSGINDTSLLYNEYIVYDVAQVNLKYLLKLKFNYKTSLW